MNKKRWLTVVISLLAVSVLGIAALVYVGTAILPAERKAADIKACDTFATGLIEARNAAMTLAQKTPAPSDEEVASAYLKEFDKGISAAFEKATKDSAVYKAISQLSFTRLSYDKTMGFNALTAIESQLTNIDTACSAIEPTPTPEASATK